MTTELTAKQARTLYSMIDNAGRGYAPDSESVEECEADLINNYEGRVVARDHGIVAILCGDGDIVIVGNQNGVWACRTHSLVGMRVEGGDTEDDYDTGKVIAVDGDECTVAWRSEVSTTQHLSVIRTEGDRPVR